MARGQQLYYEEQVAQGREDYYAGRGEAPGRWAGRGAGELGLSGELDVERLKALMDGRNPGTGEELAVRSGNVSMAAIDLTFSAPKSVSVLFAVGDERLSAALAEAHEEAVDAAVSYLEREACRVRRGHNGTKAERERGDPRGWERARSEPAGGFVAAAYRHRMSRAQDPQLHTHVVAANMARGADGRWTALDARHIYEHAKAGGSVYQAHLRQAVRERLPWASWGPVRNGMAELEQVPEPVLREFSTRRQRILERERELVDAGVAVGDGGRERIAFDTREVKREVDERDWRAEVRARAAEHGLGQDELERLSALPSARSVAPVDERSLAASLFGESGLTAGANTFAQRDVVMAVAAAAGQGLDARGVERLSRRLLGSGEVVALTDDVSARRFTTRELLDAEERIVSAAVAGRGQGVAVVGEVDVLMAITRDGRPLSEEQERVVIGVAGSGNRIDTVEALAGTGKTTSAAALRGVYERAGYRVLGAAPTGRAVRELKEQAGIEQSRTLDGWLVALEHDPDALRRDPQTRDVSGSVPVVLVVDEAGMAGTRASARLLDAAVAADVKVVAFGDSGQLSAVQAGGWLGALTRRVGSFELREVMRQRDPGERRALAKVHRGQPDAYLAQKQSAGELVVYCGDGAQRLAEDAAVQRWLDARERFGPEQAVLICRDNARRERLNQLAREKLSEREELGEGTVVAGREWRVGDRVIARRNDRELDLDNGTRGTITRVDDRLGIGLRTDTGALRRVDGEYAGRHLEHAYALTAHGMQGATVQWAAVVGRPGDFTRNWSYTALSRAREPTEILLVDDLTEHQHQRAEIAPAPAAAISGPVQRMALRMRERDDEDLALEQAQTDTPLTETTSPHRAGPADEAGRARLAQLRAELTAVNRELAALPLDELESLASVETVIADLQVHRDRLAMQRGWRERKTRRFDLGRLDVDLAARHEQRDRLAERVGDRDIVAAEAAELQERRHAIFRERWELRDQLVAEEIERNPVWLQNTLGPEPEDSRLQVRWQRTARELAGYRLDHDVTYPDHALGEQPEASTDTRLAERAITDTRAALGLDGPSVDRDQGWGLG